MTTQSQHPSFFNSTAGQMTLLGIVTIVILLIAWRYVW
jgi:hypothetical protein